LSFDLFTGLWLMCWVLAPVTAVWAIQRCWRAEPKIELPAWRGYLALAAFAMAAVSMILWYSAVLWTTWKYGFMLYDQLFPRFDVPGMLLALGGIVLSLSGKGKLRWPACFVSFAMGYMWLFESWLD
jgi:hypothetical protein